MIDADAKQAREIWELVASGECTPDEATRKVLGVRPSVPTVTVDVAETPKKRNKFGAVKQEEDGYTFDSTKERNRYRELRDANPRVTQLEVHPKYTFEHNGVKIGTYTADFKYFDWEREEWVVEDVKSDPTRKKSDYRLRVKMMKAFHGIDVKEV